MLSFIVAPDFENPADAYFGNFYQVEVTATDGSSSVTETIVVEVEDVNEAPVVETTALIAYENNLFVGYVPAHDPEGSSFVYKLSGGADRTRFTIDPFSGLLQFRTPTPNYESPGDAGGNNVYDLIVEVDDGPLSSFQAITVTLQNVNEVPVILSNGAGASASLTVNENTSAVTTVMATDPEGGVTYSLSGGADAALFTIDAATGQLRFIGGPDREAPADAGADNVYNVTVRASDGSLSDTQALAIPVANVNGTPLIASSGGRSPGHDLATRPRSSPRTAAERRPASR